MCPGTPLSYDRLEGGRRGPSLGVFPHLPRAVGDGPIALFAPRKPEILAEPEQPGGGSHRVIAEPVREPVEIAVAAFHYGRRHVEAAVGAETAEKAVAEAIAADAGVALAWIDAMLDRGDRRSEEHTSELQSLMRISYAVFCLKTTKKYMKT